MSTITAFMVLGVFIFVVVILFLIFREMVTWYWKINEVITLLAKIEENTREVVAINPKDAAAYNDRGIAYGEKGENNKAIEDFTKAIELNPKDAAAYNNRAIAYRKQGEVKKAEADEEKYYQNLLPK